MQLFPPVILVWCDNNLLGDSSLAAAQRTLRMTKQAGGINKGCKSMRSKFFCKYCHPEWNEGPPLATIDQSICCGNSWAGVSWDKDRNRINKVHAAYTAAALPGSRNGLAVNELGFGVEAISGVGNQAGLTNFAGQRPAASRQSNYPRWFSPVEARREQFTRLK